MKGFVVKLLKAAVLAGVGVMLLRFVGPKLSERMERMFEEAPEDFPPKWMYLNITAIRENTERILEALRQEPIAAATGTAQPVA